jgi:hypothetical protein
VRALLSLAVLTALAHLGAPALADPIPPRPLVVFTPPGGLPVAGIPAPLITYPPPQALPNPYGVWQGYAPSRQGWFRPRVIYQPYGYPFYAATGEPYPWVGTHPSWFIPYAGNP